MTTANPTWEDVEVPRGQYIGWGPRPPQSVTGKVLAYSMNGGTDANGNSCPQLSLELMEGCETYRDKGTRREWVEKGELVVVNASLVSLRRGVIAAQPSPGDLIKMTFDNTVKVEKGEVKEFKVQIARGSGGGAQASSGSTTAASQPARAEPPF